MKRISTVLLFLLLLFVVALGNPKKSGITTCNSEWQPVTVSVGEVEVCFE
jgi:hypothetical protein